MIFAVQVQRFCDIFIYYFSQIYDVPLTIAPKESIFSGLNNLVIHSVIDNKYSSYFGFTKQEVKQIAQYYNATDKLDEISDWYDGYHFGETEIYNP